jgi:hypothetical protein
MTSPCSCPCPLNLSITPTRAAGLAVGTGATIAWYALPDVVRSRPLRGLVKVGLLGAMGWSLVSLMPEGDELPPYDDEMDCSEAKTEDPLDGVTEAEPRELAVLAGAVLGSAVVTVAVERWLFRGGERRRAAGVRLAHTRQGLALGVLEAVATVATLAGEGRGSCPTGA